MRGDDVPAAVRDALDRRLERGVGERLDLPAVVADEMVVMVAVRRATARSGRRRRRGRRAARARARPSPRARDRRSRFRCASRAPAPGRAARAQTGSSPARRGSRRPPCAPLRFARSPRAAARGRLCPDHGDNDTRSQRRATVSRCASAPSFSLCSRWRVDRLRRCGRRTPEDAVVAALLSARLGGAAARARRRPRREPHTAGRRAARRRALAGRRRDRSRCRARGLRRRRLPAGARGRRRGASRPRTRSPATASEDPHLWLDPVRFAARRRPKSRRSSTAQMPPSCSPISRRSTPSIGAASPTASATSSSRRMPRSAHLARRYGLTELSLAGRSPGGRAGPTRARGARSKTCAPPARRRCSPSRSSRTRSPRPSPARRMLAVATLDPVEGLSEERLDAGEDYLSVMRSNLAALREALGCR